MALNLVPRWTRQSLYYAKETTWGTAITGTGFYRIRENAQSIPWSAKPIIPPPAPMGSGDPMPLATDFLQGRRAASFQTTHPVTAISWNDLFVLFFQGIGYLATTEHWCSPYTVAGVVQWVPEVTKFATVIVRNDVDAADSSAFQATSCFINQLDLSMPQNTPGETGGIMELTASWIGQTSARATAYTITTPTIDTGAAYTTGQCVFTVGTAAPYEARILNSNLSFKNGGALDPSGATTGLSQGGTIGALDVSGAVTMYWGQGAHGAANLNASEDLLDALDANSYQFLKWVLVTEDTTDMEIVMPVILTGTPTFGETNGIQTLTFNFTGAWGASTTYLPAVHVTGVGAGFEAWA